MDNRIGAKSPAFNILQKQIARLEATVTAPKVNTPSPALQAQTGYSSPSIAPLTLAPPVQQAQSNAPSMSIRDAQRYQQTGGLAQTNAAVEALLRVLSPAEKAMVQGKVQELLRDGRSIEQTSPQRFAANLALELSEHIGEGKPVSPQLNAVFNKLVQDGRSVFESNPQAQQVLQTNLAARANNLPSVLEGVPGIERTRAAVTAMTARLAPEERKMVEGKALELVRDARSIDQTNPQRFAANLALELSEHIGGGGRLTPELNNLFQQLVREGEPVFRANPRAMEVLNSNLGARQRNLP
jgi:hypothetical protein